MYELLNKLCCEIWQSIWKKIITPKYRSKKIIVGQRYNYKPGDIQ